jgi:hypothetical protein
MFWIVWAAAEETWTTAAAPMPVAATWGSAIVPARMPDASATDLNHDRGVVAM